MRILVNMPSQYSGKASGVARVTFSLLERLLEQTGDDYILRSPWTREQLPESLRDSRLELMETPRPRIMVFDVLRQAAMLPALCRRHGIDVLFNVDHLEVPWAANGASPSFMISISRPFRSRSAGGRP